MACGMALRMLFCVPVLYAVLYAVPILYAVPVPVLVWDYKNNKGYGIGYGYRLGYSVRIRV